MDTIRTSMEWAAAAIDVVAVAVIVGGMVIASVRCNLLTLAFRLDQSDAVSGFRGQLVSGLLLGLDLLVASDVIKTTALEFTLYNVGTLGLLVVVRVTLSWSLVVEAEGRWPWQPHPAVAGVDVDSR